MDTEHNFFHFVLKTEFKQVNGLGLISSTFRKLVRILKDLFKITQKLFLAKATALPIPLSIFLFQGISQPSVDYLKLKAIHMVSLLR